MQLKPQSTLQDGKYKIISVLGQGGFGITYLAIQVALNRKVAIKEFFLKDCISAEVAFRFRQKFVREAQMIAGMKHSNIVHIHDVFEENDTAYYVMEYLEGGSLESMVVQNGRLSEDEACKYIRQIGSALSYIHSRNSLHFDVKPANVMLDSDGQAVLVDFGVSKHYDEAGNQTSSTPVGISKGYAPLEQYQAAEISTFTPATDIYALGATLYRLVTGSVPPSASEINEDGLPEMNGVSAPIVKAIEVAMRPRRKDRPQSVEAFWALLDAPAPVAVKKAEETVIIPFKPAKPSVGKKGTPSWIYAVISAVVIAVGVFLLLPKGPGENKVESLIDTISPVLDSSILTKDKLKEAEIALSGVENHHEWVDLGLPSGTKWATCNVGANNPQEEGSLFAWGETETKTDSDWSNYKWNKHKKGDTGVSYLIKYNTIAEYGNVDNYHSLDLVDDAARIKWGKPWCTPSKAQWDELIKYCKWEYTTQGGVWGSKVTSKQNGISIFLPGDGFGVYMSSTLCSDSPEDAWPLYFSYVEGRYDYDTRWCGYGLRCYGSYVRAVTNDSGRVYKRAIKDQQRVSSSKVVDGDETGSINGHQWVDLGLSVKWATCNVGASSESDYGDYFAWGEVIPYSGDIYPEKRYFTAKGTFSKYVTESLYGTVDNKTRLELEDDAARHNWGGSWRMPTSNEFKALLEKCKWQWTTKDGHNGYIVTGPSGRNIFLPAAGKGEYGRYTHFVGTYCYYWTSSLCHRTSSAAYVFTNQESMEMAGIDRFEEFSVRPVTE